MTVWQQHVKKLSVFLFVFVLCISSVSLVLAKSDINEWDKGETNDPGKVWTIEFNQPLNAAKVSSTTVYVKDEKNRKFSTTVTLSSDKKSITVTPKKDYEIGKEYKLYIDDSIGSESDKLLEKTVVFPFSIAGEESSMVKNVNIQHTPYATMVSLSTDHTIARVTVDSTEMHYEGNNQYSAGIAGLEAGDTVKIRAFNADGKTVFTQEYTVN